MQQSGVTRESLAPTRGKHVDVPPPRGRLAFLPGGTAP